jgi:hypothetical protein
MELEKPGAKRKLFNSVLAHSVETMKLLRDIERSDIDYLASMLLLEAIGL